MQALALAAMLYFWPAAFAIIGAQSLPSAALARRATLTIAGAYALAVAATLAAN